MKHTLKQFISNFRMLIAMLSLTFMSESPMFAQSLSYGTCVGTVQVRARMVFTNNTGLPANDFHFRMSAPEWGINMLGANVSGNGEMPNGSLATTTDGIPDGNLHGVDVSLDGGTVAPGGAMTLDLDLCLSAKNHLQVKNMQWTFDTVAIGGAGHGHGWRINNAQAGGNGGNNSFNGGGQGGQAGGGGAGNFVHQFSLVNLDTVPMHLVDFRVLSSMSYYAVLDSNMLTGVAPIVDPLHPMPVTINPGEKYTYDINTTGSYLGGQIYFKYALASDTQVVFGSHPCDAISTDPVPLESVFTSNTLLPNGNYTSAPNVQTNFGTSGIVIRNLDFGSFSNSTPLPALYNTDVLTTNAQATLEVSIDGGNNFTPYTTPSNCLVNLHHTWDYGNTREIDIEMLGMDLSGGSLPPTVRFRESPTEQSLGTCEIDPPTPNYSVDSFFDIFYEVSLDGGVNWIPATTPTRVQLHNPTTSIPTMTEWGLIIFALLIVVVGSVFIFKRRN